MAPLINMRVLLKKLVDALSRFVFVYVLASDVVLLDEA